jgi:hypothetical protein
MNGWITVLTSAAVGVLVSAMLTLIGQYLERRARQNELLLTKALEMAVRRSDVAMKIALETGRKTSLLDDVINAETYFHWLKGLLHKGRLPAGADKFKRSWEE